jgi:hypothetical protein
MKTLRPYIVLLFAVAFIGLVSFAVQGCKTTNSSTSTTATNSDVDYSTNAYVGTNGIVTKIGYAALKIGAKEGALYAMQQDKNARAYFQAADVVLSSLINSGTYDSASLSNSLNSISVKEIRDSSEVKSWISDILELYQATEADIVSKKLNQVDYLVPALDAIRKGIESAISISNS